YKQILPAQSRPSVRAKVKRAIVGVNKGRLFVVRRVYVRAKVFRLAPSACGKRGLPYIITAIAAFAVAHKIKRTAIGAYRGLRLPARRIDRAAQVKRFRPVVALFLRDIDVAAPQTVGPVAPGKKKI